MISIKTSGSFKNLELLVKTLAKGRIFSDLNRYGQRGVDALAQATPQDSGLTAKSWEYRVVKSNGREGIEWYNTNIHNGAQVAILIQYGHGTGGGGYVQGYDYINPSIRPIFDEISANVWKKVTGG